MDKLTSLLVYARGSAQTPRKRIVCDSGRDGKLRIGVNETTESQLVLGIQEIVKELIVRLEDIVGKVDWTQAEVQDMFASIKPMQEAFDIDKKGLDWYYVKAFFAKVEKFKKYLLSAIYFTGGCPPRCAEMLTLDYRRNVTLQFTHATLNFEGGVIRYLPKPVAWALFVYQHAICPHVMVVNQVYYILKIVPQGDWPDKILDQSTHLFQSFYKPGDLVGVEDASDEVTGEDTDDNDPVADVENSQCDSVLCEDIWTVQRVRDVICTHAKEHMKVDISTSAWRHCCIMLMGEHVPAAERMVKFMDDQFTLSMKRVGTHYDKIAMVPDRYAEAQDVDDEDDFYWASDAWHEYLGVTDFDTSTL